MRIQKYTLTLAFVLISMIGITCYGAATTSYTKGLNNLKSTANTSGFDIQKDSITSTTMSLIKYILTYLGIIFLILTIISGIQWMTAQGNDDAVKKSKARMFNAVIGLTITLGAYAITYFITDLILKTT